MTAIVVPEREYQGLVNEVGKLLGQFVRTAARKYMAAGGVPMYQVIVVGHPFEKYPDIDIVNVKDGELD